MVAMIQLSGSGEEKHGIGLWYHWGQIAICHEARAMEIRSMAGTWSDPELKAVMVSVASAAAAVDSFSSSIKFAIGEPESDKRRVTQRARLKALYRRAGSFVDQRSLNRDIDWLIGGRDLLVHNREGPHGPRQFDKQAVYFGAEAANGAVEIMLRVISTCIRKPRPTFADWAWSPVREELMHALENERVQAGGTKE
jgi:hypothetical protein